MLVLMLVNLVLVTRWLHLVTCDTNVHKLNLSLTDSTKVNQTMLWEAKPSKQFVPSAYDRLTTRKRDGVALLHYMHNYVSLLPDDFDLNTYVLSASNTLSWLTFIAIAWDVFSSSVYF